MYSSGESDEEWDEEYNKMNDVQQDQRVRDLWHKLFVKSKGAVKILNRFGDLNKRIYLLGTSKKNI